MHPIVREEAEPLARRRHCPNVVRIAARQTIPAQGHRRGDDILHTNGPHFGAVALPQMCAGAVANKEKEPVSCGNQVEGKSSTKVLQLGSSGARSIAPPKLVFIGLERREEDRASESDGSLTDVACRDPNRSPFGSVAFPQRKEGRRHLVESDKIDLAPTHPSQRKEGSRRNFLDEDSPLLGSVALPERWPMDAVISREKNGAPESNE